MKSKYLKLIAFTAFLAAATPCLTPAAQAGWNGGSDLTAWCNNILEQLQRSRRDAVQARSYGDYAGAAQILLQGLRSAASGSQASFQNGPLTVRAVSRGAELLETLARSQGTERNAAMTQLRFGFATYDFIEGVARNLDLPHYVPYVNCGRCPEMGLNSQAAFERQFARYARDQVLLVLNTLAERSHQPNMPPVYPIGSSNAFLGTLASATTYAALDLREISGSHRWACAVSELEAVSSRINSGSYYNEIQAVNDAYFSTQQALNKIEPGYSCGGGYNGGYPSSGNGLTTIDLLDHSISLSEGETKTLSTRGRRYVESIIVQADARWNDTTIEVIANGKVKGTIYIPRRDPSYVVTIAEEVDSILLRFVSGGTATIRDIKATASY